MSHPAPDEDCPCLDDAVVWPCTMDDPLEPAYACTRGFGHGGDHMACGRVHGVHCWLRLDDDMDRLAERLGRIGRGADADELRMLA